MSALFTKGSSSFLSLLPDRFSHTAHNENSEDVTTVLPKKSPKNAKHAKQGAKDTKEFSIPPFGQIISHEPSQKLSKKAQHRKQCAKKKPLKTTTISKAFAPLATVFKVVALFIVVEFINEQAQTIVQFQYLDLRLLYIVIIGSTLGILPGLLASVLMCLAVFSRLESFGVYWYTLFYNTQNWLPFAGYILAGLLTGHLCNKRVEDQKVALAHRDTVIEKLEVSEKRYKESIAEKEQMRFQIINSTDSLGKTLRIVRSLDAPLPEIALMRTVSVFEKALDNRSIALYTLDSNCEQAYFHSCSKPFAERLPHALSLDTTNHFWTALKENKRWVNRDYIEECPDYGLMLEVGNTYHVAIMVCEAKPSQMTTFFTNQIKLLGELVQDSLDRSTKYAEQLKDQMYVSDTHIFEPLWFRKLLIAKRDQQKQGTVHHALLQIECPGQVALKQANDRIQPYLQPGDFFGLSPEGHPFVVISRMRSNELTTMHQILKKTGLLIKQASTLDHDEEDRTWNSLSMGA